MSLKPIDWLY